MWMKQSPPHTEPLPSSLLQSTPGTLPDNEQCRPEAPSSTHGMLGKVDHSVTFILHKNFLTITVSKPNRLKSKFHYSSLPLISWRREQSWVQLLLCSLPSAVLQFLLLKHWFQMVLDTKMEKSKPPCETSFQKKRISLKKAEKCSQKNQPQPWESQRQMTAIQGCSEQHPESQPTLGADKTNAEVVFLYDFTLVIRNYYKQWNKNQIHPTYVHL